MDDPASPAALCGLEIDSFVRGGLPGLARLQLVLPTLFAYYKLVGLEERERCLRSVGLTPVRTQVDVTFAMPDLDDLVPSPEDQPASP
jgi:hypothetical protein